MMFNAYARPGSSASDRSPGASRLANGNSSILGAGLCVRSSFELCAPPLVSEALTTRVPDIAVPLVLTCYGGSYHFTLLRSALQQIKVHP